MEHGQETMTIVDENGDEHVCEVILTFESKDFGKSYVLYHILGTEDEDDTDEMKYMHLPLLRKQTVRKTGSFFLSKMMLEWEMIEETLNTFLDEEEEEE